MANVTFEDIHKSYDGETNIIKGIDLEIARGEFLVLVGPSGCGKSTLLRLVAGLEDITQGTLRIGDEVVNDVAPRDRGVGMVFQSYALYPHMTVRENMAFGLKIRKLDPKLIERRVQDASALLDITPLLGRHPKQLSGGQRQRVAIGRAIVRQPEVFLFDEPLSNLDAALRTQMRVELKKLHQRLGATMIYVTHDQVEALTLADRIAILDKGLIQQVGSPTQVYDVPTNRFVAHFIGSPSMNFFEGIGARRPLRGPWLPVPAAPRPPSPACVGVRPQHMYLLHERKAREGCGQIEGTLEVIEPMGWEAYLHVRVGEQDVVAHVETEDLRGVRPGDEITFEIEPTRLHAFDATGAAPRGGLPLRADREEPGRGVSAGRV